MEWWLLPFGSGVWKGLRASASEVFLSTGGPHMLLAAVELLK